MKEGAMARKGKWGRVYLHGRFWWYDFSWKGRRYVGRGGGIRTRHSRRWHGYKAT